MPVLTVRISEDEKKILAKKAKDAGVSAGVLVREFINESKFVTGEDLLHYFEQHKGDKRLRVRRRP